MSASRPVFRSSRKFRLPGLETPATPRADIFENHMLLARTQQFHQFDLGAFPGIFQLSARQLLIAAPLSFGIFMIGTVLPTMVLIYAILIPRYLKLTGSSATTVILTSRLGIRNGFASSLGSSCHQLAHGQG